MHRGPAAPQIVVVHAGEVVVHERIGVHHLDRGTQFGDGAVAAPQRLVGGEHERGPQALTLAEQCVADGGGDRRVEQGSGASPPALEHRIDAAAGGGQVGLHPPLSGRGAQGPS